MEADQFRIEAAISLERLLPRLRAHAAATTTEEHWPIFEQRLRREWPRLFTLLLRLYGAHYDFFYHLEQILLTTFESWVARPSDLKALDEQREAIPYWFQSQQMVAAVLYVDLFNGDLNGLRERIDYFKRLGVTMLHLMPLFSAPEGNSDGGYAVSSYRIVDPRLGTMEQLAALASMLRQDGISLTVDFVFNHTSDEHEWALRARAGETTYQRYYYLFPDRTVPDQYDRTLREIFPTVRRGSFTWDEGMQRWVWTTFNSFQWDLNYSNPEVFRAMAGEMLFLANQGVELLRLDAVAFIWKRLGTDCENQPEAHLLIQAFNALTRIAAPSLLFLSEAIVHPDEVIKYISVDECQISYNPLLMALLWESLATRQVRLLNSALRNRYHLPPGCAWLNYIRVHDDIGWTFDDADARRLGIDPYGHRRFLNAFYTGFFPGSFARGLPFQFNPDTGDARVSGTLASLAGLEQAIDSGDDMTIDLALKRILLLYSVVMSAGGIPLLYVGDEVATLNDYSYVQDPSKADDSRWVHRVRSDWENPAWRDMSRPGGYIYSELLRLISLRKALPALADGDLEAVDTGNGQVLGYVRRANSRQLLILANFSERPQKIEANTIRVAGAGYHFADMAGGITYNAADPLVLTAYQFVWFERQ
jgi:amylosucrase